ncbi:hypothetical protein GRX03_15300 [Halovenus sp. WSH3]|uniref:DUF5658 domain-containing protein n=1 Tax=Halovenus carboxidivorans TaxID=2692199 RepID=A0A6B0T4C8_9EURY|nr:hypothetical protein [Halovenus carboxidivorans]MXR52965.1 hypothetical protein [Halovenus carboxidivorans]
MSLRQLLSRSADVAASSGGDGRFPLWLRSRERNLWLCTVAVMLIDVTLTINGLALGLEERNPVARAALAGAGALGLYGLKFAALLVGLCCRVLVPAPVRPLVPLALAVPSAIAAVVNSVLILSVVA